MTNGDPPPESTRRWLRTGRLEAFSERLVRPDAGDEEIQLLTQRLMPGLGGYLILIVVGLFAPIVAAVGYLAIAVFLVLPIRVRDVVRFRRRRRAQR